MLILKISLFSLSLVAVLIALFCWRPLWLKLKGQSQKKIGICVAFLSVISGAILIKDYPRFDKGECFIKENQVVNKKSEEWHKPEVRETVEYQVLKVGVKNYLVHSSIPSLQDFEIQDDIFVKKSDCSLIFKKN